MVSWDLPLNRAKSCTILTIHTHPASSA